MTRGVQPLYAYSPGVKFEAMDEAKQEQFLNRENAIVILATKLTASLNNAR